MPDFITAPCDKPDGNCKKEGIVCKETTNAIRFGLCDDGSDKKLPAYLNITNEGKWLATVENPNGKDVTFKAVDFCVDVYRSRKELIKRCEGFLLFENKILFIELKDRTYGRWLSDAREKFEETIKAFKRNHPNNEFEIIEPVVSNRQCRTHLNLMIEKQKLKDSIGIEFQLRSTITVL
jgi:hypothetical protein